MSRYDILVVDDDEMPAGKTWLMIEHQDGLLCVITPAAMTDVRALADAWAASRKYRPPPTLLATG